MKIGKFGTAKNGGKEQAMRLHIVPAWLIALILAMLTAGPALAQAPPSLEPDRAELNVKPELLKDVGIDQHPNAQIPQDLEFRDAYGKKVTLGQFFDGTRPVILTLNYFDCPMLCPVELNNLLNTLQVLHLRLGKDFQVLTISFNPREGPKLALQKKAHYLAGYPYKNVGQSWHFLTGDQKEISQLTQAVGFKYHWDEKRKQYVHPSGITVLTPDGKVSKYFFGIDYKPTDLRLALVDAANGKVGSWTDQVLLYCCSYSPAKGTYQWKITQALSIGAIAIVLALGTTIFFLIRHERRGIGLRTSGGDEG
jgi:protein SCO1/2